MANRKTAKKKRLQEERKSKEQLKHQQEALDDGIITTIQPSR